MISNVRVYGLEQSVKASKYPMAIDPNECTEDITDRVMALARCEKGSGHDQFLTGIIVQFDLRLSLKAWAEAQRYHFLDFVSSQSTMHRITKFDINRQCNEYVEMEAIELLERLVKEYNTEPSDENFLRVIYNIPTGFELTARMTTNYRQLKTIYSQRKNHRLPEWKEFCRWIEKLPSAELITSARECIRPKDA